MFREAVACAWRHSQEMTARGNGVNLEEPAAEEPPTDEAIKHAQEHLASAWDSLPLVEHIGILHLLVERVDYDGVQSKASLTYKASGLLALIEEWSLKPKEKTL